MILFYLTILYPNFNKKNEPNETIHFETNVDKGSSNENSCWNVVHNVCYENYRDVDNISKALDLIPDENIQEKKILKFSTLSVFTLKINLL